LGEVAGALPMVDADWSAQEALEAGLLFDAPLEEAFAVRFDKQPISEPIDLGWIGEDADGVWLKVHPQTAFLEFPALWVPVARYMAGDCEVKGDDVDRLSNYDLDVKLVLQAASQRKYTLPEGSDDAEQ
jgi:hypothetical protein